MALIAVRSSIPYGNAPGSRSSCGRLEGRLGTLAVFSFGVGQTSRMPADPDAARSKSVWRAEDSVWLDHAVLDVRDLDWLRAARKVTFWAVKVPTGFFAQLPNLELLDVRGGSGADTAFVDGCSRLRFLIINQVRGLADLTSITRLPALEYLQLFGLPQVTSFPPFASLPLLERVDIGSMKGIHDLSGLLEAPAKRELTLMKKVGVSIEDARRLARHPTIERFEWFAEDVPDRTWVPFVETVAKPEPDESWIDWIFARLAAAR